MSKFKVLIKITGSIAAYKAAYLISKLVQNDFEVITVASKYALEFIGKATLEGLTNNPVYTDIFENGKMMSHINLMKWADVTVVVPASANTINKFSAGISDNLVTSLFLARDWSKPYIIAPAMNVNMYNHPATQASLNKLSNWGVKVLETETGYLACGDNGEGKLINPDKIYAEILNSLQSKRGSKKILITSGGTKESLDGVRFIANMSTGKTGAAIAEKLFMLGNDITFLTASDAALPQIPAKIITYFSYSDLKETLLNELSSKSYDLVIHLAAVSDYRPVELQVAGERVKLPAASKIKSSAEEVFVKMKKNDKLVEMIKTYSLNKDIKLVSFKLLSSDDEIIAEREIKKLLSSTHSNAVVFNSLNNRRDNRQSNFQIFLPDGNKSFAEEPEELAERLNSIFSKE